MKTSINKSCWLFIALWEYLHDGVMESYLLLDCMRMLWNDLQISSNSHTPDFFRYSRGLLIILNAINQSVENVSLLLTQ